MKTYHLLRFSSWLTKWIPAPFAYWLCQLLGGILFYIKPSIRRTAVRNLRHVLPHASTLRRRSMARRIIRNNFKNYYDLVRLPHMSKQDLEDLVGRVEGFHHLEEAVARGKGVIVVTAHMGNFNLVPQLLMTRGFKGAVVAEDIKPEPLYSMVNELRSRFGLKFIRAGSSEVRTLYRHLKDNGVLGLAADRDVSDGGMPVKFFDAIAELPSGPVVLAYRMGIPLLPAITMRLRNNKSVVFVYPPIELIKTGDREADIEANMQKMARVLEQMVLKAPDQWVALLQKIWDKEESAPQPAEQKGEPALDGNTPRSTPDQLRATKALEVAPSEDRSPSSVS
jgi:phosphatidylinositol dimannoside acyltransferase